MKHLIEPNLPPDPTWRQVARDTVCLAFLYVMLWLVVLAALAIVGRYS